MYAAEVIRDEMTNKGYRSALDMRGTKAVGCFSYRFDEQSRSVLISKLYLLPSLHGKGIGRAMLQQVRDAADRHDAASIHLVVNRNNSKALAVYERFGFVKAAAVVTDIGGGYAMNDFRMGSTWKRQLTADDQK